MRASILHIPVLVEEAIRELAVRPDGLYVDGTLGDGGHAEAILQAGGRLLGIDKDPRAIEVASQRLRSFGTRFTPVQRDFSEMADIVAEQHGCERVDGVLLDLGLSSRQLEESGRGFSFLRDERLDMRFDPSGSRSAEWAVNRLPQEELARILRDYGEEPRARAIARTISRSRPLRTTRSLVQAIETITGPQRPGRPQPATRVFQALRIFVNRELDTLREGLEQAIPLLAPGGRLIVISYHSLEDRIVKDLFRRETSDCLCPPALAQCVCDHHASLWLPRRKPLFPSKAEKTTNPRSRSARLRQAERK